MQPKALAPFRSPARPGPIAVLLATASIAAAAAPMSARADAVEEALAAAQSAYGAGDLNGTAAQLTTATKAVMALQAAKLASLLPQPPAGWQREIDESAPAGMALMGITGTVAQAHYTDAAGNGFSLTLTADSPMVAQMAGILASPQMMAMMGKVATIGGQAMLDQDGSLSALVGGRVLVQAQGATVDQMKPVLETLNFAKLPSYDS